MNAGQLRFDLFLFDLDLAEPRPGAGGSHAAVSDQVDEVVCFDREVLDSAGELIPQHSLRTGLVIEHCLDAGFDVLDEVVAELDAAVVLDDALFDLVDWEVAGAAYSLLSTAAEEVEVVILVAADSSLDDHAPVDFTAFGVALAAPEASLQVAFVNSFTFAGFAGRFQQFLHGVEEIAVDDGLVATVEYLVLVSDFAEVVPVTQEPGKRRD